MSLGHEIILVVYCTLAFGIHGGQFITGINRQLRNVMCALPFGIVAYGVSSTLYDFPLAAVFFTLAYIGTSMGFTKYPLWFKGLVTLPLGGFFSLPLAYWIGDRTKYTNVVSEYLSGTFYGVILSIILVMGGR